MVSQQNINIKHLIMATHEPIGISEYELSKIYPADFKGSLPTIEEIERNIE